MSGTMDQNLRTEYLDVSNNLRHYGNLQFAQLTLYIAISAGALAQLYGQHSVTGVARVLLCVAGAAAGMAFLLCSRRVSEYWNARVRRAKEIEWSLGFAQYWRPVPKKFVSNRLAVAGVYWTIIVVFLASLWFRPVSSAATRAGNTLRDPNASDLKALPWPSKRDSNAIPLPSLHPDRTASVAKSTWDHPVFTALSGVSVGAILGAILTGVVLVYVDSRRRKATQKAVGEAILRELRLCFRDASIVLDYYERVTKMPFSLAVRCSPTMDLRTTIWDRAQSLPQNIPAEHLERLIAVHHALELTRSFHESFLASLETLKGRPVGKEAESGRLGNSWPSDMIRRGEFLLRLLRRLAKWDRNDLSLKDFPKDDMEFLGLPPTGLLPADKPAEASGATGS